MTRRILSAIAGGLAWLGLVGGVSTAQTIPNDQTFEQGRVVMGDRAVLPYRDRIAPENAMTRDRLETLLPALMDETGLDMWLVINREYAEDPVYFTLVPQPAFAARRTTILVFHRHEDGFDMMTVNRYPLGEPYQAVWEGGDLDEQWAALATLIAEKNPDKIGINVSADWPVADGLTHGLHQKLISVLPTRFERRLVSAEDLVIRWIETRSAEEMEAYGHAVGLARSVISEAFSSRVITPGVTTTDDVAWYMHQRFQDLNLQPWFHPYLNIQRQGLACEEDQAFCGEEGVIRRGDVIHTDVGICYLKLCTDTQEMGYVARVGETEIPQGLKAAMAVGNHWQDLLTGSYELGRTGNEVLAETIAKCDAEGIICSVYTHPLGFFGHAPGPTIGMWDNQGDTPIRGDWPVYANTCYAIEGNVKAAIPEWDGQLAQIKLEQDACFDGARVDYLAGRQTQWHFIE
ncbi:MAG: M24 family metallopeptidase [Pseudomonadota bacterium]